MDGPFLPNQKLETAEVANSIAEADNLAARDGVLYLSSGANLLRRKDGGDFETIETFPAPVSALAIRGDALAVAVDGHGVVIRGGPFESATIGEHDAELRCVTALAWINDHELVACSGSASARPHEWRRSLMQRDASGAVLRIDVAKRETLRLASRLAWPAGIALDADGQNFVVTESWRHSVLSLPASGGAARPLLANLPAYPARIAPAERGGYWLSFYSIRNQLVEFILQENHYRARMLAEIPEAYWMAPALSSGHSAKEPMQGSQLKQMGILKPYSASRSYGLVAYCDAGMKPVGAFHSRSGGERHGTVSACEFGGDLFVASKGSGALLRIPDPFQALAE